jgi:hypothetical protein
MNHHGSRKLLQIANSLLGDTILVMRSNCRVGKSLSILCACFYPLHCFEDAIVGMVVADGYALRLE